MQCAKRATVLGMCLVLAGCSTAYYKTSGNLAAYPLAAPPATPAPEFNTEAYDHIVENAFLAVADHPLSTFAIDVDTASYANVRRFLAGGELPPKDAVRIEELVNYFRYAYPQPDDAAPFSISADVAACPWNDAHHLLRIGLKGREVADAARPKSNLVFLIDVSGSMYPPNKLPLLKRAMKLMVKKLDKDDRVGIVIYAGDSGVALEPIRCTEKNRAKILDVLANLEAGGSTQGSAGIQTAYDLAEANFIENGINRVILATDGDFNVGITNRGDLVRLIQEKAKSGIFLTVLGFGMGNYKDAPLEELANKGNGHYGYIDTIHEARKMLVEEMGSTLITIAKDVKIQVEFNPVHVGAYRLIGYENRLLRDEDFNDDTKDAGEIGAGHTVTALYELAPPGTGTPGIDPLKYQSDRDLSRAAAGGELATVKVRYKDPAGDTSELLAQAVPAVYEDISTAAGDFRFAAAVAAFGMCLRESEHRGTATYDMAAALAETAPSEDLAGLRAEFISLVRKAQALAGDSPQLGKVPDDRGAGETKPSA